MDEIRWAFVASALGIGLAFGYVMQRGGFCFTRAVSNLVLIGDATILRAYVLALVTAMIGVQVLVALGLVEIPVRPFRWVGNVVGGLLFGVGMILAGGCSGSTWYRVGEGAIGAWVVLLGFAMGASAASVGVLAPLRRVLQQPVVEAGGAPPTLYNAAGVSPWIALVLVVAVAAVWLSRARGEPEHGKWPWPLTGAAVGALIAAGWWASSFGERPVGITFTVNTGHALTYPIVGYPNRVTWSMLLLVGVVAGAFIAARRSGDFRWKLPPGWSGLKIFGGGLLMGAAALVAEGCNINQGLTNSATMSVGSLITFLSMGLGAYGALWALYLRKS
ncbi:MAG: YeeE/YedE family protein [Candidatus Rokubacteria bacterium]|nr:YeeE/YedE family protein [Candidatus Rokubacteria bacterium]